LLGCPWRRAIVAKLTWRTCQLRGKTANRQHPNFTGNQAFSQAEENTLWINNRISFSWLNKGISCHPGFDLAKQELTFQCTMSFHFSLFPTVRHLPIGSSKEALTPKTPSRRMAFQGYCFLWRLDQMRMGMMT
jgi:hypothetical protein